MAKESKSITEVLANKRELNKLSNRDVGKRLGISAVYYKEVEQGEKVPSDHTIKQLSKLFDIPEEALFGYFKKEPILTGKELAIPTLKKTLEEIRRSMVREDRKQELYDKIYTLYKHIGGKVGGE